MRQEDETPTCETVGAEVAPTGDAERPATSRARTAASATAWDDGTARFVPGAVLAGRYRIAGLLGRGGMGEVYRADDLTLNQPVALKFLPADLALDRDRLDRFRAEVSISRQVSHPNVCRVYDIGEAGGLVFLSMEYIDGEDLGSLLRRIGRLPGDKGLEIARQICAGLAAAHDRGVVHRDLKPGNVMIDGRGHARIADFGLAAAAEPGADAAHPGAAGIAGTPAYMAPEQFDGKPATVASDIYALGLVLYEIFTGKRAFTGLTVAELAAAHRESTPSSMTAVVAELDPAIERTIARCLEKDPGARPSSALAVAASLPGGDPLAAALARGETPSPELVAAAGSVGTVKPAYALAALCAVVAALVGCVVLAGYVDVTRQIPLPKSPDVLRNDAMQVVKAFGYVDPPADASSGFGKKMYLDQVRREAWWTRRAHLAVNQPPPIIFWYRQAPSLLQTGRLGSNNRVSPDDPPPTDAGMIEVDLDSEGRLREFSAVPAEGDSFSPPPHAPDWPLAFQLAGFDIARFKEVTPTWVPRVYAGARAAWTGTYPNRPDVRVRVEAAALNGRMVSFKLVHEWNRPSDGRAQASRHGWFLGSFVPLLFLLVLLLAAGLSVRNLRLARGDRRGAFRVANFLFVAMMIVGTAGGDVHATMGDFFGVLLLASAQALLVAACAWVGYIALEPYVRRRWPQTLISWARLLGGRWRDPLVGWHVLAGSVVGVILQLADQVSQMPGRGQIDVARPVWVLDGFRFAAAWLASQLSNSILLGIGVLLGLFFFTLVVRRQWIAALLIALFFAGNTVAVSSEVVVPFLFAFVGVMLLMAALLRFGLLTLVVAVFTNNVLGNFPVTLDLSVWYAPSACMVLAVLAGLALVGAWTSANLKHVVPKMLGEHE